MGNIRLQNVTKQFGGQVVLDGVTLDLHTGETVGLVGANGAGKTTLFKLIAGDLPPDMGTVTRSRGLDLGYLKQEPDVALTNTLHDEVTSAFADVLALEHKLHAVSARMAESEGEQLHTLMQEYDRINAQFEAADGYTIEQRVNEILGGLGFNTSDYALPVSALSGGQKCRAALGKLLLRDSTFLLLDEPTNHLDLDAVRWLEQFLAGHHGGAVIISHDRYLLDRLVDRIVEVTRAGVRSFPGNYSNYVKTRELRKKTELRQHEKDKAFVEKERAFIAKHLAGQRTREAQGRRARLERRIDAGEFILDTEADQRSLRLKIDTDEVHENRTIFEAKDLAKGYPDKALFTGLDFELRGTQRIGITGPNGTGKSTLLKILLGRLEPDTGQVFVDQKATIAYYAQEATELDGDRTPIQHILEGRPDFSELDARNQLARFLFTGDEVFKPIRGLSGGEQSRLRLLRLILQRPNVLVLDEPTNHLDIPSREALEAALADFPGAILTVSHDRYFLDRVIRQTLLFRPDAPRLFNGNYSYAIDQLDREQLANQAAAQAATDTARQGRTATQRGRTSARQQKSEYDRMSLDDLEAYIIERESRIADLNERFGDPSVYKDADETARLRREFDQLKKELQAAEENWAARVDAE